MHHAGGKCEALFPASRERAGELLAPRVQPDARQCFIDLLPPRAQVIETRHEIEVLLDGEILVEREALGHVARLPFDLCGVAVDIETEAAARGGVGIQQPAEHADGGGFAAAVGAQETDDLALAYVQGNVVHHGAPAKALGETGDVDDIHGARSAASSMSTICPGESPMASPSSSASTSTTSFCRLSTE